jgi:hypothetical protein
MFNNLVESGSHRRDLARKGRFMLGTLALYGVLRRFRIARVLMGMRVTRGARVPTG